MTKEIIATGVPSLDLLLGGGIPARQTVIVTGDPGTGKTILCSHIAFEHAARGRNVVLATIASESHDKLFDELSGFRFFDRQRIGKEIYVVSTLAAMQKGPKEAKDLLLDAVRSRGARLLFIDGLRSLRDLWQSESKLREFLYEINVGLSQLDAIGLFTTEYAVERLMQYPEATTVDGIISLRVERHGGRAIRRCRVAKLRGRRHLTGDHLMTIDDGGVRILPRLEELTQADPRFRPSGDRAAFGIASVDELLAGGLPRASTTLLAGSTGVGKTLLCLYFAATGARAGEPSLHINYTEPVSRLVARARGIGLDVAPLVEQGTLHLLYQPAINVEGDQLIDEVLAHVRRHEIRRLVIDGLGELEHSILDSQRVRPLLSSLIVELRNLGVTPIFVKEVAKLANPDADFGDTPIAITAENLLFFRQREVRGRLRRIASVLKMRESWFDPYLREFEIDDRGIRVVGLLDAAAALAVTPETDR